MTLAMCFTLEVKSVSLVHTQGEGIIQRYKYQSLGFIGVILEADCYNE